MARSFSKNVSNYMSLGAIALIGGVNGASAISLAAWVNVSSFTASTTFCNDVLNIMFSPSGGTAAAVLLFDTSSGNKVKAFARSAAGDTGQTAIGTTSLSTGIWYHIGMVVDYLNKKIRLYTNGSQEANTTVTFSATSLTDSGSGNSVPDAIGCAMTTGGVPLSTTRQMAGSIAEVGLWKGDVGDNGMKALALGRLPFHVLPGALKNYWPLFGLGSQEPDLFGLAKNGTITGSVPQANHAPVTPFTRKRPKVFALSAGGGGSTFPTGVWEAVMRLVHYPKTVQLPRRSFLLPIRTIQTVPFPVFVRRQSRQPFRLWRPPVPFVTTNPVLVPTPPQRRQTRLYYPQKRPVVIIPGVNTTTTQYVPLARPGRLIQGRREPARTRGLVIVSGNPILLPAPPRIRQTRTYQPRVQRVVISTGTGTTTTVVVPVALPPRQRQARNLPARTRSIVLIQQNPILIPTHRRSNQRSYYPRQVGRAAALLPVQTVQVPIMLRGQRTHTRSQYPRRLPTLVIPGVTTNTIVTVPIARPARQIQGKREPSRVRACVIASTNTILLPVQKRAALQRTYYPRRVNIAAALVPHPIPIVKRAPFLQVRIPYPVRRLTTPLPLPGPVVHVPVPVLVRGQKIHTRSYYPLRRFVPAVTIPLPVITPVPIPIFAKRLLQTRLYYPAKRQAVGPLLPVLTVTRIQALPVVNRRTQYVRQYYPLRRTVPACLLPGPVTYLPMPSPRRLVLARQYIPVRRNGAAALFQSVNVTNTVLVQNRLLVR